MKHLAGSFWSHIFNDSTLESFIDARMIVERQAISDIDELERCAIRHQTPLFHLVHLYPFNLQEGNSWLLPDKLVEVPIITDRITNPTLIWLDTFDYNLRDGRIIFHQDPSNHFEETMWFINCKFDEQYLSDMWGIPVGITGPSSEEYRELLNVTYERLSEVKTHDK